MSLEQPVRGPAAYEKNDQIRPAALLVKEFADAAKYKAQAGKVNIKRKLNRTKRKLNRTKRKPDRVPRTISKFVKKKELAKKIKDIKCDSTVQVGKITSSLRGRLLQGRGSCKSTIQSAKAKCSRLANTTEKSQLDNKINLQQQ